jgi:hypothetical protein
VLAGGRRTAPRANQVRAVLEAALRLMEQMRQVEPATPPSQSQPVERRNSAVMGRGLDYSSDSSDLADDRKRSRMRRPRPRRPVLLLAPTECAGIFSTIRCRMVDVLALRQARRQTRAQTSACTRTPRAIATASASWRKARRRARRSVRRRSVRAWRGMPDAPEGTQSTQSACCARSGRPVGQRYLPAAAAGTSQRAWTSQRMTLTGQTPRPTRWRRSR